jgi:hypothetical protein
MSDLDLDRLAEIPDPFASAAKAPERRVIPAQLPPSPGRARVRTLRVVALAGALLCEVAWVALVERRPDLASALSSRLVLGLAIPLATAALAFAAVTRRGAAGLGETKARVVTLAIGAPVWFAAATVVLSPTEAPDELFWIHAAKCIGVTALLTLGPLTFGVLSFRRAFAMGSTWRGAALGVASGALGAATMALVCPIGSASHVLLGHGTMMVVAGAVGAILGRHLCRG